MGVPKIQYSGRLDRAGAILAWACFIHCIALPFLLAAVPLSVASLLGSETAEWVVLGVSAAIGLVALVPSYFRHHRNITSLMLFVAGLALILAAEPLTDESFAGRAVLLGAGAMGVTASHLLNRRLCSKCVSCSDTHRHS
jgi:hypothetical protein